jgi:hypothetical protein
METKDIKELMLSGEISYIDNSCSLSCGDSEGNYLDISAEPLDGFFDIAYDSLHKIRLTDEQHDMICEYITEEFYSHHSNNTAFTDDDIEHFNSLIN